MVTRGEDESNRKAQKEILLSCQDETYYYDETKDILAAQVGGDLLETGAYSLDGSIVEASYQSQIKKYIQEESGKNAIKKVIDGFKKRGASGDSSNTLSIQYTIVENDKAKPIKRHNRAYSVVGYLDFRFLLDDKLVYEARADYIGRAGEDISRRVKCILTSFEAI
jgi:hypothetical protein